MKALLDDIRWMPSRLKKHRDDLKTLCTKHNITPNIKNIIFTFRNVPSFREQWLDVWTRIAKAEGGKIGVMTAGILLASFTGGAGLAMMGGAINIHLMGLLGLAGFVSGAEVDSRKIWKGMKRLQFDVPPELHVLMQLDAQEDAISIEELALRILQSKYATL